MERTVFTLIFSLLFRNLVLAQWLSHTGDEQLVISKLPAAINTSYEEAKPMINDAGDRLYFVRSYFQGNTGGEEAGEDIWYSEKNENGEWSPASNRLFGINNRHSNILAGINFAAHSTDLAVLGYDRHGKYRDVKIELFRRGKEGNIFPGPVAWEGITLPLGQYHDFYLHPSHNYLLMALNRNDGLGEEDIYLYRKVGQEWEGPIHLGNKINSNAIDAAPFLRADGNRLYFASNRTGGHGGMDIWFSDRIGENWTDWTQPKNLGPLINSPAFDCFYYENNHGVAVYASNRESEYADLYLIERMKESTVREMTTIENKVSYSPLTNKEVEIFSYEIYFEHDKSTLNDNYLLRINKALSVLLSDFEVSIRITGYTDATGTDEYNLDLSAERAAYIARLIEKSGRKITYSVKGLGKLRNTNGTTAEAKARKVVITGYRSVANLPGQQ